MPPPRQTPTEEQQAKIDRAVELRDQARQAERMFHEAVLEARDSHVTLQALADAFGFTRQNMEYLERKWRADTTA